MGKGDDLINVPAKESMTNKNELMFIEFSVVFLSQIQ